MKTLNYHSFAKSYRKFAVVCSFASCIAFLPIHAGDTDTTPDKDSQILKATTSESRSSIHSDNQTEEEIEMEVWMLNPEHQSWLQAEEKEIILSQWMTDIRAGNWINERAEEEFPALQNWMLTPKDWL